MPVRVVVWLLVLFGSLRRTLVRSRTQLGALVLAGVVAALVTPGPWDADVADAAKPIAYPARELPELRSAKTKTARLPDGTLKTTVSQQSLHYVDDADESWREIDATFKPSTKQGKEWESGRNRFTVELAREAKAGFLTLRTRDGALSMSLEGGSEVSGLKTGENAITFVDVVKDVDIEYVLLPDGLKENIVLRKSGAPAEYRFRLDPAAGTPFRTEARADGSVWFYRGSRIDPAFVLTPPVVGDSSDQTLPQAPSAVEAPPSWSPARGKASMEVETAPDGSFLVTLKVDERWLRSEDRVYPVILDPTLYVQPDTADGEYDTTAGGDPDVTLPEIRTGRNGAGGAKFASVLSFDLATLPPGATVLDARLNLHLSACFPTSCGTGHTGTVELRRLVSGWSATTHWSPSMVDPYVVQDTVTFSTTPAATWHRWSSGTFTETVQSMISGEITNHGFILQASVGNDDAGYKWRSARWSDPSFAPNLEVYWVADGVQVDPATRLHSNGAELVWQHFAGGTSAYVDAVFQDAPAAYFRLDEGSGQTTVWDWSGNDVAASVQTPTGAVRAEPGPLADGNHSTKLLGSPAGYVKVTDDPVLGVDDTFTLEAWIRRLDLTPRDMAIFNDFGSGFWLRLNYADKLELLTNGGGGSIAASTTAVIDTNWHHIAATKSGGVVKLFIDGDDVTGAVTNQTLVSSSQGFHVGLTDGGSQPWFGWIDDVALYPSALAEPRIDAHYAQRSTTMASFERFEIHRSASPNFTPSTSTLIGSLADAVLQSYRDTTAKAGSTFYYEVVTVTSEGSFSSNEVKAVLPAAGLSQVTIQPGFVASSASATHIASGTPNTPAGTSQTLMVGSSSGNNTRALLSFDLRSVPAGADVTGAQLSLYALGTTGTINAHRLSAAWSASSATWNARDSAPEPDLTWSAAGGDFDGSAAASSAGGSGLHWDTWEVGSLVEEWVNGQQGNLGFLLKYGSESGSQPAQSWAADEYSGSIALRPKLVVTYADGVTPVPPTVAVAAPAPSELVKGTVTVKAGALDDGSVAQVEFFLDGSTSLGVDTAAPYEVSWNSTTASRGNHTLTARARDDAGNETTSLGVQVTVANSTAPSGVAVTSATPQGGGAGNVPPSATASADPTSGAAPLDVDFTGSGSDPDGSIAAYAWDLDGDGAYDDSSAQNPSFQYGSNGLHYARLRVTDDDGAHGFSTPLTISVGSSGAAPTVVGTPTADSGNDPTSGTWALPSGWQAGDLALVWWYARTGAKTITEGATITQKIDSNAGSNWFGRMFVGYRYLQAGDSNPTWTASSSANASTVWGTIVLRGGPSSGDPFEAASSVLGTSDTQNPDPPAVTTLTDNALVLTFMGKINDGTHSPPAGYTERGFAQDTAGADAMGAAASIVKASAGLEDPGAWTLGGGALDESLTWTASVPSGGGGGGNQPPSATASADPTSGAAPLDVDFTGSGSDPDGSIAAYAWDLDGDGAYDDSSAQNPSHEYTQAGTHRAWLRVTDNQGAYGFSGAVAVTVGGSTALWDVTATASDDYAVSRVEFYVNGNRFATDSSAPYSATWDTLDEANVPGYDGQHAITVKAYDEDGNATTSSTTQVTVANGAGTLYQGLVSTTNVPLEQSYDPGGSPQDGAPLTVSLTNNSGSTWPTASIKLRYRWYSADTTPVVADSGNVSIGADLAASGQRDVALTVDPPSLPTGVYRARYRLRIDLYDTAAPTYFAAKGNKPFEAWVTVTREGSDELGLERYQQYDGEDLGGGFDHALNLANGNNVVQWVPFSQPGRGLNTVVRMTYNALEHGSVSPLGNNWSLSLSSLTPFGLPLDVHPNAADTAAGRTQKWVGFTDGDGSYHVFTGNAGGTYYAAPPGVHLYLKPLGAGGWELWKPDRTKFVYDSAGFPTSAADANGNTLTFTLASPAAGEDAYGLAKRVTKVTDAGGRDFTLSYFSKAETPRPALRGRLKKLTDHVGHALELSYYEDGNLRSIREKGGPGDDGLPTPDREVFFTYTTPDGSGPAITSLPARQNPDPLTVQSPKLYSVIDFRGNETSFAYSTAADPKKWRITGRTNRAGNQTTFAYDTVARTTTATMPLSRVWTYSFDVEGRVTQIDDPVNTAHTTVEWADASAPNEVTNTVRKVTQPTGEFVEYAYNANGYKTDEWDELRNRQTFEYENLAVDANDASGNWEPGRSIPHLSQLSALVKPRGNATPGNPDDYRWEFAYTGTGLLDTITDPLGNVTDNAWNANGTLAAQTLPNNGDGITRTTTFDTYDANGLPTRVTDAAGGIARAGYAANGSLVWEQDPNHGSYAGGTPSQYRHEYHYDAFGRLVRSSRPKSTAFAPGLLVWEGTLYDANDNETTAIAAHYGRSDGGNGASTTTSYDGMDRETLVTGPRGSGQGGPVQTKTEYDAAGRVVRTTKPKGVNTPPSGGAWEKDHVTETAYDLLDRELTLTAYAVDGSGFVDSAATRITNYCYDDAGDLRSVTGPKGAASFTGCPSPTAEPYVYTAATHTTKFIYDDAHRQVKQIDALTPANETETAHDENGQVVSETDEADKVTETQYDDRGLKAKQIVPFDGARKLTTVWEYDALGNLKRLVSPRAFDAAGGQAPFTDYVESYSYDALGRLVKTTLPTGPGGNTYAASVLADGPRAYWRFGFEGGNDQTNPPDSGAQLHATANSSSPLVGDPEGSTVCPTYFRCATVGAPNETAVNGSLSIEAWVKTSSTAGQKIFTHDSHGARFGMGSGGFGFEQTTDINGNRWLVTGGSGYADGNWHHAVAVFDDAADTLKIYVDGALVASNCSCDGAPIYYSTSGATIGGTYAGEYLQGSLDEVAVYGSALSASQVAAHYAARLPAQTPQAYRHQAYDANGNLAWTSLPTTAATPGAVTEVEKTLLSHWDSGSIHSSQDPATPKVRFDYTAEGWQSSRIAETASGSGTLDFTRAMYWSHLPDGLLRALLDQGGERALYVYDANGNRTQATEATGLVAPGQGPLTIDLTYSSLDELTKVRTPKPGASGTYLATLLAYDLHGNTQQLVDNREENGAGSETAAGRVFTYTYDAIEQATAQSDDFSTSSTPDDEQLLYTYRPTGELETRTLQKRPTGSWENEQSSERTYFENGLLKALVNRNGAGTVIESHTLSYIRDGLYLNGNRASDTFLLKGPDSNAPCYTHACTAWWSYDARDRLMIESSGHGQTTAFTLDVQGNVVVESGTVQSVTRTYAGQQLQTQTQGGVTTRYLYDSLGNLDCTVKAAHSGTACPAPGSSNLIEDNVYDYKSRLVGYRYYNGAASASKTSDYTIDPLDRPVKQVDWVSPSTTTNHDFTYVGVTNAVSREVLSTATNTTKRYAYDVFGQRSTITEGSSRYSYLYDPHTSVSLLIDQANAVKESYGYTAYGSSNAALSKSASGFNNQSVPKNPYRYTGKRLDSGSGTYDMGARRYSAQLGRFLQYDVLNDALDNLDIATDPLTQNRYALAGANPINFVEIDGHAAGPLQMCAAWAHYRVKLLQSQKKWCKQMQAAARDTGSIPGWVKQLVQSGASCVAWATFAAERVPSPQAKGGAVIVSCAFGAGLAWYGVEVDPSHLAAGGGTRSNRRDHKGPSTRRPSRSGDVSRGDRLDSMDAHSRSRAKTTARSRGGGGLRTM